MDLKDFLCISSQLVWVAHEYAYTRLWDDAPPKKTEWTLTIMRNVIVV